ncbi:hypothetical protein [Billgrantia aerodenitrificans]|uniref:Uncharacterized protein n=1 Tax=Billgrantia aerodenitrificans TaxID=2733483 RepID=A0ABS9AVP2_9GAMM|nr:hypothetical protein [Halomonas aerodenitrificans]MCE8025784.1 hypothetical protein [Halomonas aerodenitrificans]
MFELVTPRDRREDNDALINAAQTTLHALGYPATMRIAVSLLLLAEEVMPLDAERLRKAFGEEIACLVEASRAVGEPGNEKDWHASLEKFAQAPADCQTLRMALIHAAIERGPEPTPQMDFWYAEALALPAAHPGLRAQVIARLEADMAALYAQ